MKRYLLFVAFVASIFAVNASDGDKNNISYVKDRNYKPDPMLQAEYRNQPAWRNFQQTNGTWWVEFNELSGLPRRAMGKPIPTSGSSWQNKALNFVNTRLADYAIPLNELQFSNVSQSPNFNWVWFHQYVDGKKIFGSELVVKITNNNEVVMFGTKVYSDVDYAPAAISASQAESFAQAGLSVTVTGTSVEPEMLILPVESDVNDELKAYTYHLVYEVLVEGSDWEGIPVRFYTLVDAVSGKVWYRADQIMHSEPDKPVSKAAAAGVIEMDMEANVFTTNSYNPATVEKLANLDITINSTLFQTDLNGFVTTTESGPASANISLSGKWSTVFTGGVTPTFSANVVDGINVVDFTGNANIRELTAYYHVNQIHDHMKFWIPTFTGMDFSLPTNIDVAGSCNAFYDGTSINFFVAGSGCTSFATVADIVYHEYGHGINDNFYSSQGSFFVNGAMGEGYADFWAMSLTLNPKLGEGSDDVNVNEVVRRYDIDPKVYPDDILGEVHADGEIICGAWWDTYINLGNDMTTTMSLFVDAYYGLQATASNGNEGEAFTNVLIDALQADDVPANGGDNDITNGTPNGVEIADAFAIHGITLVSNAFIDHTDLLSAPQSAPIDLIADLTITFPFQQYLGDVNLVYKINASSTWNTVAMTNTSGNVYAGQIPAQPFGTLITYYIALEDINGNVSAVTPIGAAAPSNPNTPYFILVGYTMVGEDDVADFNQDFGNWTIGLPTDNATTGEWVAALPIGSFGTPGNISTMVQTNKDHTVDPGDICFVTGNANTINDPIGTNDVDDGSTSLVSPVFDLSVHQNPTFSYWKWYTNNPPSGANPKADWWQVYITNDGGGTWVPIEETLTGQREWRRYAFRVQDYLTPTNNVQLKFVVSDSIHLGQNLDGGSLVEGALDDIRLWDNANFWSVSENDLFGGMKVYPNPSAGNLNVTFALTATESVTLNIYDAAGREVYSKQLGTLPSGEHKITLDQELAAGLYNLRLNSGEHGVTRKFKVVR